MASENPLDHVLQHPLVQERADLGFLTPKGVVTILSDQIVMMILAGLLLVLFMPRLARRRAGDDEVERLVPSGPANFIEAICQHLREVVARPVLREHTDRFIPYLWSAFFFVLTVNLLGLLPIGPVASFFDTHLGGTATGNIWVTATLALLTMILMVFNGLRFGGLDYIKHFSPGPLWLSWLLVPVELMGLGAKTFALAVRLFANMIAGHLLLAILLGLIFAAAKAMGVAGGLGVGVLVVLGSVAVTMLEIFVAFLQAFIFTLLTALFIGMSVHVHPAESHH